MSSFFPLTSNCVFSDRASSSRCCICWWMRSAAAYEVSPLGNVAAGIAPSPNRRPPASSSASPPPTPPSSACLYPPDDEEDGAVATFLATRRPPLDRSPASSSRKTSSSAFKRAICASACFVAASTASFASCAEKGRKGDKWG